MQPVADTYWSLVQVGSVQSSDAPAPLDVAAGWQKHCASEVALEGVLLYARPEGHTVAVTHSNKEP